jgi:LmbE family N-acetylglucosaminyl deacetylase
MAQAAVVHPLEPLFEGWQRGRAIVAHPDDLEFGAAAAIARWTGQGKQIVYCLVTSGEAGIDAMAPAQARRVREAEQRAAAAVVGVEVVEFLGQPDGVIEYGGTAAARAGTGRAPPPARNRDHHQLPGDLGRGRRAQSGRSPCDRVGRPGRRGRCGQPMGVPRAARRGS